MKYTTSIIILFLCCTSLQAQKYKELPAYIWLSFDEQSTAKVFVENKNTNEKMHLEAGCYQQTDYSIEGSVSQFQFCISKEQIINGNYFLKDKEDKFETKIYIENSLANKSELYLNGHLAETMVSNFEDSIMRAKNYTASQELLAERIIYLTGQDSGKSITKKYQYDGNLHYIDNEITGRLEEFDTDGKLGKLTETNPKDSTDITTTHFYKGKKKSVIKGKKSWLSELEEQYDSNEILVFRKIRNDSIEITEQYENGQLSQREQWFLNESKSIVEHFSSGQLQAKEIITNRYSLDGQSTEYYDAKNKLIKTEKLRAEAGTVYTDIFDAKGQRIKTKVESVSTSDGTKEGSKAPPPTSDK